MKSESKKKKKKKEFVESQQDAAIRKSTQFSRSKEYKPTDLFIFLILFIFIITLVNNTNETGYIYLL